MIDFRHAEKAIREGCFAVSGEFQQSNCGFPSPWKNARRDNHDIVGLTRIPP